MARLPRSFYAAPGLEVAAALIGKSLVHRTGDLLRAGRIVETEAYVGHDDRASHARFGKTPRAALMFGPPGYAYVYLIYGMHHCFNVVCDREDFPAAVLVRAVEPAQGVVLGCNGPGKLCAALGITRAHNGLDLTAPAQADPLWLDRGAPGTRTARGHHGAHRHRLRRSRVGGTALAFRRRRQSPPVTQAAMSHAAAAVRRPPVTIQISL